MCHVGGGKGWWCKGIDWEEGKVVEWPLSGGRIGGLTP